MTRPDSWSRPRLVLLFLLTVAGLALLLYSVYGERQRALLEVGMPSPQTFTAPVDIEVVDHVATERQRQAARNQIETVFTGEPRLQQLMLSTISALDLPEETASLLLSAYNHPQGVLAEDLPLLIIRSAAEAPEEAQSRLQLLLSDRLLPTSTPNLVLTQAARDAASASVPAVTQSLQAGQTILREGEPITDDHLQVLQSVGLYSPRYAQVSQVIWIALGCVALSTLLSLPLLLMRNRLAARLTFGQLAFFMALVFLVLAAQRLALIASPAFLFLLVVPLILSVLLSVEVAVISTVWLGIIAALLVPTAPVFTMVAVIAGGVAASLLAGSLPARSSLLFAGAVGGALGAVALSFASLTLGGYTVWATAANSLLVLGGGVLAGVIALGLLPLAESSFGFLTEFRLVELSSPASPLLQRLLIDAPGTYQHSLIISNLVEQAVRNIGGDFLLARVGALYHDVGKLRRPHFYTENQFAGENPHDRISPHLSYLIIVSHVRDGVELLQEHNLPAALEPFVSEHHGTTVLTYFYKRALEENAALSELNFRYPGPRPRSKETAILMLADAVESASRSLSEPSQGSIRALIDRLVEQRLQDQQLSESNLNFRDIEVIKSTFERMLTAILHRRISYPTPDDIRGAQQEGGAQRGRARRRDEPVPAP